MLNTVKCTSFVSLNLHEFVGALAMKFAVDEINNSSSMLPCTRLGYDIHDTCSASETAVKGALEFLHEKNGSTLNILCNYRNYNTQVIAVIGPSTSEMAIATGKLFNFFHLPQVFSSERFSNKLTFQSFFRTVPSDSLLAQGIVQLLKEFQWNWVALVASTDEYGKQGSLEFSNQAFKSSVCLAYEAYIPEGATSSAINGSLQHIILELKQSGVNVTVLISSPSQTYSFLKTAINHQLKMVWIASTSWSLSSTIHELPGMQDIGTVIGFTFKSKTIPGYEDYIRHMLSQIQQGNLLQNSTFPNQNMNPEDMHQFQDLQAQCKECSLLSPDNISVILDPNTQNLAYRVYTAVYCASHALHNIMNSQSSNCSTNRYNVFPHQLLNEMRNLSFSLNGVSFSFDSYGNLITGYDIVTWRYNGRSPFVIVGDFQEQLTIRKSMIGWNGAKIPRSTCSRECTTGQIKVTKGFRSCCFECLTCPEGTYVNSSGKDLKQCSPCPAGEWSKPGSKACQLPTFHFLTWGDYWVIGIFMLMTVILLLILGVVLLFIKYQNTAVVFASGRHMICLVMLGLSSVCLSVFFYIGQPNQIMCLLQQPFLSVSFTTFLGPILVKSIKLVVSPSPGSCLHWLLNRGSWIIIVCSFLGQMCFGMLYVLYSSPFSVASVKVSALEIHLSCQYEPLLQFSLMFAYNGIFVLVSFICSFMAEAPVNQYNLARDITFAMLTMIMAWIIFIPTYASTAMPYKSLIQMVFILSSCLGILAALFFPKCYIVIYKKELNCNEYFGISTEDSKSENDATVNHSTWVKSHNESIHFKELKQINSLYNVTFLSQFVQNQ
uniref:Taste receptor type 1 member 3 n=1 Tax=Leptobrachium leishanense TaxID=445787 RepID=A0A8C5PW90_9ANUR